MSWDLCHNGSIYYWQLPKGSSNTYGESSGSVDLIAMIKYLETNGYLPSSSTMTEVSYGFMIYTTTSTQETFTLNRLHVDQQCFGGRRQPDHFAFSHQPELQRHAGRGNPSAQNVTVSNSGGGTLAAPTTQINYSQGSGWLSVNCTGSQAPYTCSTQPATGSLAAGTYNATVQVSSAGATNTPQTYTVAFTVNAGAPPAISLSPTSLQLQRHGGRRESILAECHREQLRRRHAGHSDHLDHLPQRKRLAQCAGSGQPGPLYAGHPADYREPRGRNLHRHGERLQHGSDQLAPALYCLVYPDVGIGVHRNHHNRHVRTV